MPFTTALYNAYYEDQKEREKKQAGVTYWEDIFKAPYETAAEQVQAKSAYDISDAYSAFKRNQLNLMTQQQLGEGFKESIADQLRASYEQQYSGIRQTEASKLFDIQSAYEKQLASQEERVAGMAKFYSDLEKSMYEFAGIEDLSLIEKGIDYINEANSGYGYYRLNPETGEYEQTEYGKSFMKDIIESGDYVLKDVYGKEILDEDGKPISMGAYSKWLAENNPELYEQYIQNVDAVREMIGGYEYAEYKKEQEQKESTSSSKPQSNLNLNIDNSLDPVFEHDFLEKFPENQPELYEQYKEEMLKNGKPITKETLNEWVTKYEKEQSRPEVEKLREKEILEQTKNLSGSDVLKFIREKNIDDVLAKKILNNNTEYNSTNISVGVMTSSRAGKYGDIYTVNGKEYDFDGSVNLDYLKQGTNAIDDVSYKKLEEYINNGDIKMYEVFDVTFKNPSALDKNKKVYLMWVGGKTFYRLKR